MEGGGRGKEGGRDRETEKRRGRDKLTKMYRGEERRERERNELIKTDRDGRREIIKQVSFSHV